MGVGGGVISRSIRPVGTRLGCRADVDLEHARGASLPKLAWDARPRPQRVTVVGKANSSEIRTSWETPVHECRHALLKVQHGEVRVVAELRVLLHLVGRAYKWQVKFAKL